MKLVLLNGAPRSGKDTAAQHLYASQTADRSVIFERFSMPIKQAFAAMVTAPIDEFGNVDGYESDKGKIIPLLGVSYRQWQIDFSEKFIKPLYGESVFSLLMLDRLQAYLTDMNPELVVIPDSGVQIEIDTLVAEFPPEDILLIRLERPGTSFAGDSREYVEPAKGMKFALYANVGSIDQFHDDIDNIVDEFLKGAANATS